MRNEDAYGQWKSEKEAQDALVRWLSPYFYIYEYITGYPLAKRYWQEIKNEIRADIILMPTPDLRNRGWQYGCIVVECKAPNEKLGPAVTQVMDYMRCAFPIPNFGGCAMIPTYGFCWPFKNQDGATQSIMAQSGLGVIHTDYYHTKGEQEAKQIEFSFGNKIFITTDLKANTIKFSENVNFGASFGSK